MSEVHTGCLQLDIIILADLSGSVSGKEDFIHDAVSTFINKFDVDENGIRIGLITFSSSAILESGLSGDKHTLNSVADVITPYSAKGSTNLSHAFEITLNEILNNGRIGVMKMIVVITDGEPNNKAEATQRATLLKSLPHTFIWGIYVDNSGGGTPFPFYLTQYSNEDGAEYLKSISSPNCYIKSDFNNLVDHIRKLDICL